MTTRPILELCTDPYATRRRADRGLAVPCGRCFFEEPGVGRGCKAVNRGMKVQRPPLDQPRVSPLRGERADVLQLVLPTADVSGGPGPEYWICHKHRLDTRSPEDHRLHETNCRHFPPEKEQH